MHYYFRFMIPNAVRAAKLREHCTGRAALHPFYVAPRVRTLVVALLAAGDEMVGSTISAHSLLQSI